MMTKEEMLLVAEAAENYKPGFGNEWTCNPAANERAQNSEGRAFGVALGPFRDYW